MLDQMYSYFNQILSKHQCGFRHGHSTQHSLYPIIEKLKKCLDNSGVIAMLLTDLSNAFDFLKHDLIIAKRAAYGFDQPSVYFISNYLSDRTQRAKVNSGCSFYTDIKYGVPQGSRLDLLFNIDICDLFLWDYKCNIASYADDTTRNTSHISLNLVLEKLERTTHDLFRWFKENHIKANLDKCNLLLITNALTSVNINGFQKTNNSEEKLLDIKGNPNFQDILDRILQILHYYCRKQHKNIENSEIVN